jgi:hypothetical protein
MADQPVSHDFGYVHTDIPAGMTIREWRAQRAADRGAAKATGQSRRWSRRAAVAIVHVWLHGRRQRAHRTGRDVGG